MNAQRHDRFPNWRRPHLAVVSVLSLAALLVGLVAMHAGMVIGTDADPTTHSMAAADAGAPSADADFLAPTTATGHSPGRAPGTCPGMCDAGCAMTGTACMAGPAALTGGEASRQPDPVLLLTQSPRSDPVVARRVPHDRPPSLTALSISRI